MNTYKQRIIEAFQASEQSEDTLTRLLLDGSVSYFTVALEIVPNIVKELKKEGLISVSGSKAYDCGAGNGLAIETFYKLSA